MNLDGFAPAFVRDLVDALHPSHSFAKAMQIDADALRVDGLTIPLRGIARADVLGLGKASVPQVAAARAVLAKVLPLGPALAITKAGQGDTADGVHVFESSHPLCDARAVQAAGLLRDAFAHAQADDLVVLCLSGGGSALAVEPRKPFTLDDKIAVNRELLRRGAPITDANAIRQAMSCFKGGGLLSSLRARTLLTLVTVDIPSGERALVASGPTIPSPRAAHEVAPLLARWLPEPLAAEISAKLANAARLPAPPPNITTHVATVGDHAMLVALAERIARDHGTRSIEVVHAALDTTLEQGLPSLLRAVDSLAQRSHPALLLSGGELTVDVRGQGRGGRNTEFVARAAEALFLSRRTHLDDATLDRALVFSLATDGSDGPTDAAGGYATRAMVDEDHTALRAALVDNDSLGWLERIGGVITTGGTGTNLMDLRGILIA
ncbi:MAG: DUF4147 domain-containing protein [Planctomycetota bacterium]